MQDLKIYRGQTVSASDGEVGHVEYIVMDPQTHEVTNLVVARDGDEWLVPMSRVGRVAEAVEVTGSRAELLAGPRFVRESYRQVDEDEAHEAEQRAVAGGVGDPHNPPAATPVGATEHMTADDTAEMAPSIEPRGQSNEPIPLRPEEVQHTIELREERLVAHKEPEEAEVQVRIEAETVPARLEVEALREEVEVEHIPVGEVVTQRASPWEEDGALMVPVYEEQLVVVKRLYLREHLRIRRLATNEIHVFEDELRRERLAFDDPAETGLIREVHPVVTDEGEVEADQAAEEQDPGILERVVRKAFQ
jgi:uncharacterized protein (TIGR02271 family)